MARLGCRLPNMGSLPRSPGIAQLARLAEEGGVSALHLSDHIVLPESTTSKYPFTADGVFPFAPDSDWYDVFTSCAWASASTTTIEVGPSVLVLPQRNPLEVAKVASSLSQLSGGRFFLGVGAGWLQEEFTSLGMNFANRASAMLEAIDVLRLAWSGSGHEYLGEHYRVPKGTQCRPLPTDTGVPILMGGMSNAALRRAARFGDGWIALASAADVLAVMGAKLEKLHDYRREYGNTSPFRTVIRVMNHGGSCAERADQLRELWSMGFDEVVIDPGWQDLSGAGHVIEACRRAMESYMT